MVDMVLLLLACGSIHFPARPGTASWPAIAWDEEVVYGATVAVGISAGGSITIGSVADERVADGNAVGGMVGGGVVAESAVTNGGMVALGVGVALAQATTVKISQIAVNNIRKRFRE